MPSPQPHAPAPRVHRPFVGRDGELGILRGHLGDAGLVAISGDPGIGKTRLAEEFAAEAVAQGALVHWGRCWEGDGAPAFWPWIQILRALNDHAPAAADEDIARVLADLEGRPSEAI